MPGGRETHNASALQPYLRGRGTTERHCEGHSPEALAVEQSFTKMNSKQITDLKVKLLEDKMGETLDDLCRGNNFLDTPPKAIPMKETIAKSDFIKIQNFCSAKDSVKRIRGSATTGEKTSALLLLTRVPQQNSFTALK